MGRLWTAAAWLAALAVTAVAAEPVKGTFIGNGTYATPEGCKKLAAIEKGGPKNISTTPETLTIDGFETWEGGCSFSSIKEVTKGKAWRATMACSAEIEQSSETDTFTRNPDGSFSVMVEGDKGVTRYVRCKGN